MLRIARDDRASQHALDRTIGIGHGIEGVGALVLDRDRLAKVRVRDPAGRSGQLQREVLELDDLDAGHGLNVLAARAQRAPH